MFKGIFLSATQRALDTWEFFFNYEERKLLRGHSQTRKHWVRECKEGTGVKNELSFELISVPVCWVAYRTSSL